MARDVATADTAASIHRDERASRLGLTLENKDSIGIHRVPSLLTLAPPPPPPSFDPPQSVKRRSNLCFTPDVPLPKPPISF
ncbi:hypothetical protein BST61_g3389 [Cercospora zeina]